MRRRDLHEILLAMAIGLSLAACGSESSEPVAAELPSEIRWDEVEGASRYVVRGFAGDRLLFEEISSTTELTLSESIARSCAAFDTVDVVVRARGLSAPAQRLRLRP